MSMPTEQQVKWAAKTLFSLANTPATQTEINMFWENPQGSSRWIKALVAKAQPQTGGGNGNAYNEAINILTAYGIDCYRKPR